MSRALIFFALALLLVAAPALAGGLTPEQEQRRSALFDALDLANSDAEARLIEGNIWQLWLTAPNADAQAMMDIALERRWGGDLSGAIYVLNDLVKAYPDYSEGWNQRATLYFMQGRFDDSLADIEKVMALEPRHFGALSGKALILSRLGKTHEAQTTLQHAIRVNPWLLERHMLLPEYREEKL